MRNKRFIDRFYDVMATSIAVMFGAIVFVWFGIMLFGGLVLLRYLVRIVIS